MRISTQLYDSNEKRVSPSDDNRPESRRILDRRFPRTCAARRRYPVPEVRCGIGRRTVQRMSKEIAER